MIAMRANATVYQLICEGLDDMHPAIAAKLRRSNSKLEAERAAKQLKLAGYPVKISEINFYAPKICV